MGTTRKRTKAPAPAAAAKGKPRGRRRARREAGSRGLSTAEVVGGAPLPEVEALRKTVEREGGTVVGAYRDPLGGHGLVLAALPLERVGPTPFQRDLSDAHVTRLAKAIEDLDRYLDPIVAVEAEGGGFWTPNGNHRLESMRRLGAKCILALVVPERETAYRILTLNTEKAHNLREKALEVVRMARDLARLDARPESEYAVVFEEPSLLTLGLCYEGRPRFSGGVYHPALKRVEEFLDARLPAALKVREGRAQRLFALDDAVAKAVAGLRARGFESPYLKNFVVARVDPLRFQKGARGGWDATIEKMVAAAEAFDPAKVRADQVARSGGPPPAPEG